MPDNTEDLVRKWIAEFLALLEDNYESAPRRLTLTVELESGAELSITRTPISDDAGDGRIQIEFTPPPL